MYSTLVMGLVKENFKGVLQVDEEINLTEENNNNDDDESNWSMILETVSCRCLATWKWIKQKTCGELLPEQEASLELQAAVCISHSLPELQRESEDNFVIAPDNNNVTKKVLRQTTLPVVPTRLQTFQRQLSHRLEVPKDIEFSVCSLQNRTTKVIGVINPELYKEEMTSPTSVDTIFPEMEYSGNLLFALRYDDELETLIVKILEATNLPIKDGNGSSDPYVKVCLLPDSRKKFKTKVHRKTLNPVFNETFGFSVPYEELRRRYLQFTVYDFDRLSRHDLIGHVVLNNLLEGTDLRKEVEYTMKILCPPEDRVHLGELMVRLCYLPMAGRLTITVIRARHLKFTIADGKPDPYVKVYLICQGKRIRKQKTHVRNKTIYPLFNEALFFDIPEKNIDDVTLILQVMNHERFKNNAFLGCAAIGAKVIGMGREHWLEMRMNPRTPLTQWYTLMDSIPGINLDKDDSVKSLNCLNSRLPLYKIACKFA